MKVSYKLTARAGITHAINNLRAMKKEDIKARKKAKPSRKSHWTRSITATTKSIDALIAVRQVVKQIPKRV